MYASQTPNENPGVLMDRAEAEALFTAVDHARQRIVAAIAKAERSRVRSEVRQQVVIASLRADLVAFEEFAKALGEAHNLGGY